MEWYEIYIGIVRMLPGCDKDGGGGGGVVAEVVVVRVVVGGGKGSGRGRER